MKILPAVASVVTRASPTDWAQVLQTPQAYAVIQTLDSSGQALRTGVSLLGSLTRLLEKMPESVQELKTAVQEIDGEHIVSLTVVVPRGQTLDVIQRGEGSVYLKRGKQLACLLSAEGVISGDVAEGDVVILADKNASELLTDAEIITAVDHELTAEEIGERLAVVLNEKSDNEGAAMLVFQIKDIVEEEPEQESVAETEDTDTIPEADDPVPLPSAISHPLPQRIRHFLVRIKPRIVKLIPGSNKKLAVIVFIFAGLFGISVYLGIKKQGENVSSKNVAEAVSQAQSLLDEGLGLLSVNREQSRIKLETAQALLQKYKDKPPLSKEGKRVPQLYQQISDNLEVAKQIIRGEPQLFYDLDLIKKGAYIHKFAVSDDTLGMLDENQKTVFVVRIPTKDGDVLAGGEPFTAATAVAAYGKQFYVLTGSGIYEISSKGKIPAKPVIEHDETWGTIGALVAYGGNLYLSDLQKSRIWKYVATEVGFDVRREYLNPDTLPNLSQTTSMAIDGHVWFGTKNGEILRFAQGKADTFSPIGIEPPLGEVISVYTTDDLANIYILDAAGKRVVVLQKDGRYTAQYVWNGEISPELFLVSEQYKKIFLVAQGKLYALDLR